MAALGLLWPATSQAGPTVSVHVEAAAAHAVDDTKSSQFGWGGLGVIAPELAFGDVFGLELAVGAMVLSANDPSALPEGVAESEMGLAGFSTVGPRVRPFAPLKQDDGRAFDADGLWLASGFGAGLTGELVRPTIRAALGFDVASSDFAAGPFAGYFHMIEPDAGSVFPEDARVAIFGLHGALLPASRQQSGPADSDGDQVPDPVDKCLTVPEDKDGFQDDDGCPDPDNDQDGVPDAKDACATSQEDKDGFQDADGCPDADNDGDAIADADDACREVAEDKDGFEDEDGCPEDDDDQDGIPDATDTCAQEPETKNGIRDEDGCPDSGDLHVNGDHIVLEDRVQFTTQSQEIGKGSWDMLSRVAEFLNAHPEYVRIHVSGHADDTGSETFNQRLSQARADSVRTMLVKFGVEPSRLQVAAFGESKPREAGTSQQARAQNRRVEFEIVERAKRSAP